MPVSRAILRRARAALVIVAGGTVALGLSRVATLGAMPGHAGPDTSASAAASGGATTAAPAGHAAPVRRASVRTASRTSPGAQDSSAQIAATVRALFAAAERGDLAALDTLYAGDSLTVIEGAGINRGWADYRDHHLGPEMRAMRDFRYRPLETEARVAGAWAWATFRYALQGQLNGRALDQVGRGTAILERRGSGARARWVVRHTQTSSRPRRVGDPPMPDGANGDGAPTGNGR